MVATVQGVDYDRVIGGADEVAERRRLALPGRAAMGLVLIGVGLVLLLFTWLQIKDIQNVAAQIPYIASGGLAGVAAAVIGGIALFAAGSTQQTVAALSTQVEELSATVAWTADVVEQMAHYLNELGVEETTGPAARRARVGRD